jgi:hypothetical protein
MEEIFWREGEMKKWNLSIYDQLINLSWPETFIVEYVSGEQERLLRGEGVSIGWPDDNPDEIGDLCADLPLKHPRNRQGGRLIRFTELRAIYTLDGKMIWSQPNR